MRQADKPSVQPPTDPYMSKTISTTSANLPIISPMIMTVPSLIGRRLHVCKQQGLGRTFYSVCRCAVFVREYNMIRILMYGGLRCSGSSFCFVYGFIVFRIRDIFKSSFYLTLPLVPGKEKRRRSGVARFGFSGIRFEPSPAPLRLWITP